MESEVIKRNSDKKKRRDNVFLLFEEGHGNSGYCVCVNQKPTADSDVKTETKLRKTDG